MRAAAIDGIASDSTLTRMGQLVYLPRDQKYRIGPSAVAMSTSMMRGLQLRNLIRQRLEDVAEQLPGTVGFVIPDRFHLVYLEHARAVNALGLHEGTGSRIAMTAPPPATPIPPRSTPMSAMPCWRKWSGRSRTAPSCCGRGSRPIVALERAWLCRRVRIMEPSYQRLRGSDVVAAISNLRRRDDRPSRGDV